MVKNTLVIIIAVFFVSGCGIFKTQIKTETQTVYVPVMYCPVPPQELRPDLPIHLMSAEQAASDGELVKHYKATTKTLIDYSERLEDIIYHYSTINALTDETRTEIVKKLEEAKADINTP